jgi:hypothetical protein
MALASQAMMRHVSGIRAKTSNDHRQAALTGTFRGTPVTLTAKRAEIVRQTSANCGQSSEVVSNRYNR